MKKDKCVLIKHHFSLQTLSFDLGDIKKNHNTHQPNMNTESFPVSFFNNR